MQQVLSSASAAFHQPTSEQADLVSSSQHFHPWPKASLWPLQPTLSLSVVGQRCQGFTAPLPHGIPQLRTEGMCSMFPGSLAPCLQGIFYPGSQSP